MPLTGGGAPLCWCAQSLFCCPVTPATQPAFVLDYSWTTAENSLSPVSLLLSHKKWGLGWHRASCARSMEQQVQAHVPYKRSSDTQSMIGVSGFLHLTGEAGVIISGAEQLANHLADSLTGAESWLLVRVGFRQSNQIGIFGKFCLGCEMGWKSKINGENRYTWL